MLETDNKKSNFFQICSNAWTNTFADTYPPAFEAWFRKRKVSIFEFEAVIFIYPKSSCLGCDLGYCLVWVDLYNCAFLNYKQLTITKHKQIDQSSQKRNLECETELIKAIWSCLSDTIVIEGVAKVQSPSISPCFRVNSLVSLSFIFKLAFIVKP